MAINTLMRGILKSIDRGDTMFQTHMPGNSVLVTAYARDIHEAFARRDLAFARYELKQEGNGYSITIYW